MAQFDIYRVRGGALVLDCQCDLLEGLRTRFVVPLRSGEAQDALGPRKLNPVFDVDGQPLAMMTPLARGIDVRDIEATLGSLAVHRYAIQAALDFLVSGF